MRHSFVQLASGGLLLTLALLGPAADAQGMQSPAQWYINQNIYSTRVFNGVIANSMIDATRTAPGAAAAAVTTRDVTSFARSTPRLAPSRLAARGPGGPATRRTTETYYDAQLTLYEKTAMNDRFPSNDLAYAYQYFVVNSYHVYHDLVAVPADRDPYLRNAIDGFDRITLASRKRLAQITPYQERALYEQFRQQLGASPEVQKMTDAEKQEAAEMLAIGFGITFDAYIRGIDTGDEALLADARRAAKTGLEKMLGRPIDQIRIGNLGLE